MKPPLPLDVVPSGDTTKSCGRNFPAACMLKPQLFHPFDPCRMKVSVMPFSGSYPFGRK